MSNPARREQLHNLLTGTEARVAGFPSGTQPSGYFMPERIFYTYYRGQIEAGSGGSGSEVPASRKVILITDGSEWFVGAQTAGLDTDRMLGFLHKGIQNGQRERYLIAPNELAEKLRNPDQLPEVEIPDNRPFVAKIDTNSHGFE